MEKARTFKILIVDDEDDIREIVELLLAEALPAEFIHAKSGNQAIALLSSVGESVSLVLSDYNMNDGNGAVLHQWVRSKFPQMPFILMTSDYRIDHGVQTEGPFQGYVQKPFSTESLVAEITKVLSSVKGDRVDQEVEIQYLPVSTSLLIKLGALQAEIFNKINDRDYVSVFGVGATLSVLDLDYFARQKIRFLYVDRHDYKKLILTFVNQALTQSMINQYKSTPTEAIKYSKSVQEILTQATKTFGWSEEIFKLGETNISLVKATVENVSELNALCELFKESSQEDHLTYSVMQVYFQSWLFKDYKFKTKQAFEILAYAAFFADLSLDEHTVKNQFQFVNALRSGSSINKEDREKIWNHPIDSVEILKEWKAAPLDLKMLIWQHHEAVDGSGFPRKISGADLCELMGAYVVSYELVQHFLMHRNRNNLKDDLVAKSPLFNKPPVLPFFEIALKHL